MIKNQKQVKITEEKIKELIKGKEELEKQRGKINNDSFDLSLNSFNSMISDLERQMQKYKSLCEGNFHCFQPESLEDISEILISARLAQKISQKELGEKIGVKEQQIQRYEATDYETASWTRIMNIAIVLELRFYFNKIMLYNLSCEEEFLYPQDITSELAETASIRVRNSHSLIFG